MGYMTFEQQVNKHLIFLQNADLDVTNLIIGEAEFIRVRTKGKVGRGDCAYKTSSRILDNGMTGLITWCRQKNGQMKTCKTYGYPPGSSDTERKPPPLKPSKGTFRSEKTYLERIQKFWDFSSQYGESDYLKRKGVGAYGIRFRENRYGKVGIIPMIDGQKRLCSYQILNSNGSKMFAKGVPCSGLFHPLTRLTDGLPTGIAESYVTAATCLELTNMQMVTAFTSNNLEHVVTTLRRILPNNSLVIFADNDRHLNENKGIICAHKAIERAKDNGLVLVPNFNDQPCTRDYSDWNDLVQTIGSEETRTQILQELHRALNEKNNTMNCS